MSQTTTPSYNLSNIYQKNEPLALSQPFFASGDGFFLYSRGGSNDTSWGKYDITPSVKLNAIDFNSGIALFAGNNGVVVKFDISEGVEKTEIKIINPNINFNDIKYYSAGNAIMVGDSGSIYRTQDYGTTWNQITSPVWLSASLQAITFSSHSSAHWWICGKEGTVITSSNQGTSWFKFTQFVQLDSSTATPFPNPPYTGSLTPESYDFYDIKFQTWTQVTTFDPSYNRVYVVGSSGSIFANQTNNLLSDPVANTGTFIDISLGFMQSDFSHTSSTYNSILYTNEYYFTGSGTPGNNHSHPTNVCVSGDNGKFLFIDYCEGTTGIAYPTRQLLNYVGDKINVNFTNSVDYFNSAASTYVTHSFSAIGNVNFGGFFNTVYGTLTNIFYDREFFVVTENGLIVEMDYPSFDTGKALQQSTPYGTDISQSFDGAITDLYITSTNELVNYSYVSFTLNEPLPDNTLNNEVLWYGLRFAQPYAQQGMRIYRGIEGENFISVDNEFPNGKGFIIPQSYTPGLNYLEIAKKAGLLPNP